MKKKTLILGAGISGLALAYFLKQKKNKIPVFEKETEAGGLCRSLCHGDFTFDISGHFLHFRKRKTFDLIRNLLGSNLVKHRRNAWVYSFDRFIPYPFQAHLWALPKTVAYDCCQGFIEAKNNPDSMAAANFLDWIQKRFGKGIARHFMVPYNSKFWNIPLHKLSYEWAERFIVVPSSKKIIEGLAEQKKQQIGYHSFFWYPRYGGIGELIKSFSHASRDVFLKREVCSIDIQKKKIKFKDGSWETFERLVTTMPLPELGKIMKKLPERVKEAFEKLRWLSIYNVNLGLETSVHPKRHWIYFPDKNIRFFRVGFFHNISATLVPHGKGSLYVDVSYLPERFSDKKTIVERIKKDLDKIGIIGPEVNICCENINDIKYGYPIFDHNYYSNRETILRYLLGQDIISCGRYGGWQYLSMEDTICESEKIACLVNDGIIDYRKFYQ